MSFRFTVSPKRLNTIVSGQENVHAKVEAETRARALVSARILKAHRDKGHSRIELVHARRNGYIVLSDERGLRAAMEIEFGTRGGFVESREKDKHGNVRTVRKYRPPTRGVRCLRAAMEG